MDVSCTAEDILVQLHFHEVHHRAQALNILKQLGVRLPDLDYNTLRYRRVPSAV